MLGNNNSRGGCSTCICLVATWLRTVAVEMPGFRVWIRYTFGLVYVYVFSTLLCFITLPQFPLIF